MPVVGSSSDLDIITLAEAQAALNITNAADKTATATELAQVVSAASRMVDSVFGPVVQRTVTKTVVAPSGTVWLDQPAAVTSVTEYVSGVATVLTAETATTAGTYRLDATSGALRRRSNWSDSAWAANEVVVVYTAGRAANTAAVDPKFKAACAVCVVHLWQHRGAQSGFGSVGGDGAPFGGVPFSTRVLRDKLRAMYPEEALLPGVA